MKNRKWLTYTLGTLLTIMVLAAVAVASFRVGMMHNATFARPAFAQNFDARPQMMPGNPHNGFDGFNGFHGMQGDPRQFRNDNRGGEHRGHGMFFFPPIFGLIHLLILAVLLWVVYKLVQSSGWRLTRVVSPTAPTVEAAPIKEKKKRNS